MENYLPRIRKFSVMDTLSEDNINSVIDQVQHNVDLIYGAFTSSHLNWNVSELLYGNMLDFDSTGQKRFVNGGKIDTLEKVIMFKPSTGQVDLEVNTELVNSNGDPIVGSEFIRWTVPANLTNRIYITRNIAIPEALRHQNILIAFKVCGFQYNEALTERFDIFVNGQHAGTGDTGTHVVDGKVMIKTIYGTYGLRGTESNLDVRLVRSSTLSATPTNYKIRLENAFVGLQTLSVNSYLMNYPATDSSFRGSSADINSFYDFSANAVIPIPKFIASDKTIEGISGQQVVNVTVNPFDFQSTYYVSLSGSGNNSGMNDENKIPISDFFNISSFAASQITVYIDAFDEYPEFKFTNGNFLVYHTGDIHCNGITVDLGSHVKWVADIAPEETEVQIRTTFFKIQGKSRLDIRIDNPSNKLKIYCIGKLDVLEHSTLDIECGIFGMPLDMDYHVYIFDHSHFNLRFKDSLFENLDSLFGFGYVTAPYYLLKHSYMDVLCENKLLGAHISHSTIQDEAMVLKNHCNFSMKGFLLITTYTNFRVFYATLHSSIEINTFIHTTDDPILCPTAFTDVIVELFSSFGSLPLTVPLNVTKTESFVYTLENV